MVKGIGPKDPDYVNTELSSSPDRQQSRHKLHDFLSRVMDASHRFMKAGMHTVGNIGERMSEVFQRTHPPIDTMVPPNLLIMDVKPMPSTKEAKRK